MLHAGRRLVLLEVEGLGGDARGRDDLDGDGVTRVDVALHKAQHRHDPQKLPLYSSPKMLPPHRLWVFKASMIGLDKGC